MIEYKKEDPHKDIGKSKFRVKTYYTAWVEYDVEAKDKDEAMDKVIEHGGIERIEWQDGCLGDAEVYAQDYNFVDHDDTVKVAECVPYEDTDIDTGEEMLNYEDPEWTSDEFRWKDENVNEASIGSFFNSCLSDEERKNKEKQNETKL
jgi:hypothetical protein